MVKIKLKLIHRQFQFLKTSNLIMYMCIKIIGLSYLYVLQGMTTQSRSWTVTWLRWVSSCCFVHWL